MEDHEVHSSIAIILLDGTEILKMQEFYLYEEDFWKDYVSPKDRVLLAEYKSDSQNALLYLKKHVAYNDSLINEANIYAVVEMEGKYEHEKQQLLYDLSLLENVSEIRN